MGPLGRDPDLEDRVIKPWKFKYTGTLEILSRIIRNDQDCPKARVILLFPKRRFKKTGVFFYNPPDRSDPRLLEPLIPGRVLSSGLYRIKRSEG
jgi:hypothetical protein